MNKKYYVGLASTFHDPSIAIVDEKGEILFAESTERYLQNKRAMGSPADPIVWADSLLRKYCDTTAEFHIATTWSKSYTTALKLFNASGKLEKVPTGISKVLFDKLFQSMLPDSNLIWFLKQQLVSNVQAGSNIERNLRWNHKNDKIIRHRFSHHAAHAASAAYASGFDEAVCLVVDGIGEQGSISCFEFKDNRLTQKYHHKGLESLGFFYTLVTHLCGFDAVKGEEWKVMGMAPYGKINDQYYELLDSILTIGDIDIKFKTGAKHVEKVLKIIGDDLLAANNSFEKRADLAFTGQLIFSKYMHCIVNNLYKKGISENLVYAGGCALNSSFNGKLIANSPFKKLYVPSAPADDGTSIGAAWLAYLNDKPNAKLNSKKILSPYLGSTISDEQVKQFIKFSNHDKVRHCPGYVHQEVAKLLVEGKIIGWAQGQAEFGPRALGNRSILADPRPVDMKDRINARVKFREEFRPFAPSILAEFCDEYFENYQESPYMERTLRFRDAVIDKVPAVVHLDQTGRLQTVKEEWNKKYYQLIKSFYELTGVPLLLNTSFNVMGKPIIHSFDDALAVFFNSGLDALIVNDYIIEK